MVALDDNLGRCKLELNNAKRIRHYWQSKNQVCDCGCDKKIYISGKPICLGRLIELLNDEGFSVSINYRK